MANSVTRYLVRNLFNKINPKSRFAGIKTSAINNNYNKINTSVVDSVNFTPPVNDTDYQDVKNFKQFIDESDLGSKAARTLTKVASVPKKIAEEVVKDFKIFEELSKNDIVNNYATLRAQGLSTEIIKEHPYVLAETPNDLGIKLWLFDQMKLDLNDCVRLFEIPARRFPRYLATTRNDKEIIPEFNNRIEYLANKLETTVPEVCKKTARCSPLLGLKMERIVELTNNFLSRGLSNQVILNHLFLYSLNFNKLMKRCAIAKQLNIDQINPWFLRSPEEMFTNFIKNYQLQKAREMPYQRVNEYVMARYNCSAADIESLYKRFPKLRNMDKKSVTEKFILLHDLGYTFEEIFISTRCFQCATDTLHRKYELWVNNGLGRPSLAIISSSNGLFTRWLKQRKSNENIKL